MEQQRRRQLLRQESQGGIGFGWFISGALAVVMSLVTLGCSNSGAGDVESPKQAATQVEQVFQQAPAPVQQQATVATEALRSGDYEKAIETFAVVQQGEGGVTLEQGRAIKRAMVAMEAELIQGVNAGDAKAERAYKLLQRRNRN